MGQCVGAEDYEQAVYYTKRLMKVAYLCLLATNLFIFCFAGVLVPLFGLSAEATASAEEILQRVCTVQRNNLDSFVCDARGPCVRQGTHAEL